MESSLKERGLSAWMMSYGKQNPGFPGMLVASGLWLLVAFLLMLQPDFGMTFVVTCVFASQIFLPDFLCATSYS